MLDQNAKYLLLALSRQSRVRDQIANELADFGQLTLLEALHIISQLQQTGLVVSYKECMIVKLELTSLGLARLNRETT